MVFAGYGGRLGRKLPRDLRALLLGVPNRFQSLKNGRRKPAALQRDIHCGEFGVVERRDPEPLRNPVAFHHAQERFENGNRLLVLLRGFQLFDLADVVAHELAVVLSGRREV